MEAENQDKLSLEELLAHFALFTAQDDDDEKNVVKVMTIHTAKGLEFDIVFICGLVDGQFQADVCAMKMSWKKNGGCFTWR